MNIRVRVTRRRRPPPAARANSLTEAGRPGTVAQLSDSEAGQQRLSSEQPPVNQVLACRRACRACIHLLPILYIFNVCRWVLEVANTKRLRLEALVCVDFLSIWRRQLSNRDNWSSKSCWTWKSLENKAFYSTTLCAVLSKISNHFGMSDLSAVLSILNHFGSSDHLTLAQEMLK